MADRQPRGGATDRAPEERLPEVAVDHPYWVKLIEVGIALGADWRSLIGLADSLDRENKVEKVTSLNYPAIRGQRGGVRHAPIDRP